MPFHPAMMVARLLYAYTQGILLVVQHFRQFLLRGLVKVQAEGTLVCTAHNLLKVARAAA